MKGLLNRKVSENYCFYKRYFKGQISKKKPKGIVKAGIYLRCDRNQHIFEAN